MAYRLFVHNKLSSVIPQKSWLCPVQPADHRRLSVSRVQAGSYMRSVFVQSSRLHVAHLPTSNRLWSLGQTRVVIDLSFSHGQSVNSGIPSDTYLGEPLTLRLPGIDALLALICTKGPGCHIFKKDFSQAYRQLRIDPRDYHYLGFHHDNHLYFDVAPPFGLRSAAMMCQCTTSAVTYMYKALGFDCTNYIDNFGGTASPDTSAAAFLALGDLFSALGLESSPDKDSRPSVSMTFLGILVNTLTMTISVTRYLLRSYLWKALTMI